MSSIRRAVTGLVALSVMWFPTFAATRKSDPPNCELKRLTLGSFGDSAAATEFRLILESQLVSRGFEIVELSQTPQAILEGSARTEQRVSGSSASSGTGAGGTYAGSSAGSVSTYEAAYVALKVSSPDGKTIWRGYFKPKASLRHVTKSALERRAIEVTDAFVKACAEGWPQQTDK